MRRLLPADSFRIFRSVWRSRRGSLPVELAVRCLDGDTLDLDVTAATIAYGGAPALEVIFRDATRRKASERDLVDRHRQLRMLADRQNSIAESERSRLAQGLYEDIGQLLSSVKLRLALLARQSGSGPFAPSLAEIEDLVDLAVKETRSLTRGVCPPVLRNEGLPAALQWMCSEAASRYGVRCTFSGTPAACSLPFELEALLFGAVEQLLATAVDRAGATRAWVSLRRRDGHVRVRVENDGTVKGSRGANGDSRHGLALQAVRFRLEEHGGLFSLSPRRSGGEVVCLDLPVSAPDAKAAPSAERRSDRR